MTESSASAADLPENLSANSHEKSIVPVGVFLASGVLCVICEIAGFFLVQRPAYSPPSLWGLSMGLGAILLGVAVIYQVRGQKKRMLIRTGAIIVLIIGLLGPMLYSLQSVMWRMEAMVGEIRNTEMIITGVSRYQKELGGYPPNLAALLAHGYIKANHLKSPLGPIASSRHTIPEVTLDNWRQLAQEVDDASDYEYWGADLTVAVGPEAIMIHGKDVILGSIMVIGLHDGDVKPVQNEYLEAAVKASNAAREKAGLSPVRPNTKNSQ